jgi:hypothetical protein
VPPATTGRGFAGVCGRFRRIFRRLISPRYNAPMRRRVLTILLFLLLLLLGAIVNVAVAWGCAAFCRLERPYPTELEPHLFSSSQPSSQALIWLKSGDPDQTVISQRLIAFGTESVTWQTRVGSSIPPFVDEVRSGWPVLSLRGEFWCGKRDWAGWWHGRQNDADQSHGLIQIGGGNVDPKEQRRIPLFPIWRGFAFNTLFYTAILWLLIAGPFVLRRLIRRRRGRCPRCGYDLRGATPGAGGGCPECGWNRQPEATA